MELKTRSLNFRKFFTILYIVAFLTYLIIGLQPARAISYDLSGGLAIPSIDLIIPVATLELKDHRLDTPDDIVGSYSRYDSKIFLVGHSSTAFKDLAYIKNTDLVYYNNKTYRVFDIKTLEKSTINMDDVLAPTGENSLVIMTCAGDPVGEHDATHRLIVSAVEL